MLETFTWRNSWEIEAKLPEKVTQFHAIIRDTEIGGGKTTKIEQIYRKNKQRIFKQLSQK